LSGVISQRARRAVGLGLVWCTVECAPLRDRASSTILLFVAARGKTARGRKVATTDDTEPTAKRSARRTGTARETLSKEERRAQILVAARTVFAKIGYARATVDDIVREAGVARGTYYLYFDDKRAALEELINGFALQIADRIVRIVTDNPAVSVSDQVLQNIRGIVGVCLEQRALTKILFTDAVSADPEFQRKLQTFYDGVVQLLTESLRDGQALGVVADGEPRVLAYLTIGALKELLYQAVTLGLAGESTEALTRQLYSFLGQGYLRVGTQVAVGR
jgi:AcrR family transcriptional regulator